jgi:hypothetical protein
MTKFRYSIWFWSGFLYDNLTGPIPKQEDALYPPILDELSGTVVLSERLFIKAK